MLGADRALAATAMPLVSIAVSLTLGVWPLAHVSAVHLVQAGFALALLEVPAGLGSLITTISDNPLMTLLVINIMLLLLGTFMDMAPLIVITTPIFLPVAVAFGVGPVHFGVILVLNLGIGLCTPPVGAVLFVGCAVGRISVWQAVRTIWPFYGAAFATLMLVTYIPALSLWLPSLFH
jgi:tripartite ATP-independent transporter DctM subunit